MAVSRETQPRARAEKIYVTQQMTQHLVAAELYRLGYNVTFTSGNSPLADLVVSTSDGSKTFFVDVKGQATKNAWMIKRRPANPNLFYICVVYGKTRHEDLFFVLTHEQESKIDSEESQRMAEKGIKDIGGGFLYKAILPYKDNWSILPSSD